MAGTRTESSVKIEEALELLSEAARDKKEELKGMISDKYSDLKDALFDGKQSLESVISETRKRAREKYHHAKDASKETMQDFAERLDENVHYYPWSYISGVAFGALLLGFILGRKRT